MKDKNFQEWLDDKVTKLSFGDWMYLAGARAQADADRVAVEKLEIKTIQSIPHGHELKGIVETVYVKKADALAALDAARPK